MKAKALGERKGEGGERREGGERMRVDRVGRGRERRRRRRRRRRGREEKRCLVEFNEKGRTVFLDRTGKKGGEREGGREEGGEVEGGGERGESAGMGVRGIGESKWFWELQLMKVKSQSPHLEVLKSVLINNWLMLHQQHQQHQHQQPHPLLSFNTSAHSSRAQGTAVLEVRSDSCSLSGSAD